MSEQLDRIENSVTEQGQQINQITQLLGGNEKLKQKGLVEDYREIKGHVYKNKEEISKMKSKMIGITTAIGTAWGAFITWLNS